MSTDTATDTKNQTGEQTGARADTSPARLAGARAADDDAIILRARAAATPFDKLKAQTKKVGAMLGRALRTISSLGWGTAVATAVLWVLFASYGWVEALAGAALLTVLLVIAIVVSLGGTRLHGTIELPNDRVRVGDAVPIAITLENNAAAPSARTQATVKLTPQAADGSGTAAGIAATASSRASEINFAVHPLAPHSRFEKTVTAVAARRGVLTVGPVLIRRGDAFGLIRNEHLAAPGQRLYIHPHAVALPPIEAGITRDLEGSPTSDIVDDDLSFYGLRDYQPGDDVRNIHWLSTAKAGHAMVRQYQATKRTDASLSIALDPSLYADENEFEEAVRVHASLGLQCLNQGRDLTITTSRQSFSATDGVHFLDQCSLLEPVAGRAEELAVQALDAAPTASLYMFIVGSRMSMAAIQQMTSGLPGTEACLVFQVNTSRAPYMQDFSPMMLIGLSKAEDAAEQLGLLL